MHFKQLEIVGFKSFPHKTKLKFEPGITAVVGPNGCGKSNISDAIRWVLGEQSPKSLRGSSMEDVIFNGTDTTEAINMAEVSLTLANEDRALPIDYNEVTITRRLFRSGESEYVLNKTAVRLKDIQTLLMGTGMGTSSYSIIEQGKIDRILSSRPEDRRYIFEEASGITKYKSKKREALRKLEHTESNLIRISDIINEVKRQINSIERHAKKAERYKSDFEVMKDMDLKLATYELKNINSQFETNTERLALVTKEEGALRCELDETLFAIQRYRQDMDSIISRLTETQKKLSETTLFVDKSRHKIELDKERINDLRNIKENSKVELARLQEKVKIQAEEIIKVKERFGEALTNRENSEKGLTEKEESLEILTKEIDTSEQDIKKAKDATVSLLAAQTRTKNELIKLGADLSNRKTRLRRLETEKESIKGEKENIESLLKEADSELEVANGKITERKSSLNKLKENLVSRECSLEDSSMRITESKSALNALGSKEEILKEMIRNMEGFDKGVKLIAEAAKSGALNGVIGVIADMLKPENGYERALEVALSEKAQGIVVENQDALKGVLELLGSKGSVHFIILDDIKNGKRYNRHKGMMDRSSIPALSSLVKIDPSFQYLADYLLDDTYVVSAAQSAQETLRQLRREIRIVSKDGFLAEKGHVFSAVTGNDATTSIIGRTNRLEGIREEKTRLEKEIETLALRRNEEKQSLDSIKEDLSVAEGCLKKEEIEHANVLSKKESIDVNLKKISDEFSVIELESGEVDELIRDISVKGEELNVELNKAEEEYSKNQVFISSLWDIIQNNTKAKSELILGISELKSQIAFLKNTEDREAKSLEKENALLSGLNTEYETKAGSDKDSEEKISMLQKENICLEEEIVIKKDEEESLKSELTCIMENKNKLSWDLQQKENFAREKEKTVEELKDQIRNSEIKKRENELKIVNLKDRIRQAYKLDAEEVKVEIEENVNWEDVRNHVEVLRIKLEKLGPVNLVAIDEHKELEERHAFLTQQQEDLVMAKDSLHKAIVKINRTTKELFMEAFTKIQVEFRSYYRMLFGGGHAELLLLDESDVLESGIEIVVRPPGKKLQNLLLLSGGEKALTAISLLFAIFKVKPSPFCILDEVDAPLDETNIGRFTRILNDFLKTSQFIVITHSKKTMQMANVLYGITMEKKGVSKIVSVKFTDDEESASSEKEKILV